MLNTIGVWVATTTTLLFTPVIFTSEGGPWNSHPIIGSSSTQNTFIGVADWTLTLLRFVPFGMYA